MATRDGCNDYCMHSCLVSTASRERELAMFQPDWPVFHLAISNMAQRHVAFRERHVALHEHHVALCVRHVALRVRHVAFPIFKRYSAYLNYCYVI